MAKHARNGIAAALAALAASGYLLVSGALDPMLSAAVTLALGKPPVVVAVDDPVLHTAPITDWMYFDDRPEWSSLRKVPTLPTRPDQPVEPARPLVAPPENPHRWQFTGPPPMPHYQLKPPSSCFQPRGLGETVEQLTAVPGVKRATVSWWDLGDPDTRSYELAIVPVGATGDPVNATVSPIRHLNVPAPNTCRRMVVEVPGLRSGRTYRFWLLANNESQVQQNRAYRPSRGETESVTIS